MDAGVDDLLAPVVIIQRMMIARRGVAVDQTSQTVQIEPGSAEGSVNGTLGSADFRRGLWRSTTDAAIAPAVSGRLGE